MSNVCRTRTHAAVAAAEQQQYSAETQQTRKRSAGSKSIGDENLLCYDGPRNEEPIELMHEDFQVHVDSDWVRDLLEKKNTTGVIV